MMQLLGATRVDSGRDDASLCNQRPVHRCPADRTADLVACLSKDRSSELRGPIPDMVMARFRHKDAAADVKEYAVSVTRRSGCLLSRLLPRRKPKYRNVSLRE